jgi:hypothetical protein
MNLIRLLILLLVAIPAFGATTGGIAVPSLPSTNAANQLDLLILESRTTGTNSRTTKITVTNFADSLTNYGFSKGTATVSNIVAGMTGPGGSNFVSSARLAGSNYVTSTITNGLAASTALNSFSVANSNLSYAIGTASTNYTDKRQYGSAILTNLSGTGAMTNGIVAGGQITLTTNGPGQTVVTASTNITSLASGSITVGSVGVTNGVFSTQTNPLLYSFAQTNGVSRWGIRQVNEVTQFDFDSPFPGAVNQLILGQAGANQQIVLSTPFLYIPNAGTPGVGKVLTSDSAGFATWATASGGSTNSQTGAQVTNIVAAMTGPGGSNFISEAQLARSNYLTGFLINTNQFATNTTLTIKSGALLTNTTLRGTTIVASQLKLTNVYLYGSASVITFPNLFGGHVLVSPVSGNSVGFLTSSNYPFFASNYEGQSPRDEDMVVSATSNLWLRSQFQGANTPTNAILIGDGVTTIFGAVSANTLKTNGTVVSFLGKTASGDVVETALVAGGASTAQLLVVSNQLTTASNFFNASQGGSAILTNIAATGAVTNGLIAGGQMRLTTNGANQVVFAASTNLTTLAAGSATLGSLSVTGQIVAGSVVLTPGGIGAPSVTLTVDPSSRLVFVDRDPASGQTLNLYNTNQILHFYDDLFLGDVAIISYNTNYFSGSVRAAGGVWAPTVTASSTVKLLGNATNSSPSIMLTRNPTTGAIEDSAVPSVSTNLTTLASGSATLGSLIVTNTIVGLRVNITNSAGPALTLGGAGSALRIADQSLTTQSWDVYANNSSFRIYDNVTNQNIFIGRYGTNYFAGNFRASGGVWATNVTASSTVTLLGNATNASPSIMLTRNASTGAIEDSAVPNTNGIDTAFIRGLLVTKSGNAAIAVSAGSWYHNVSNQVYSLPASTLTVSGLAASTMYSVYASVSNSLPVLEAFAENPPATNYFGSARQRATGTLGRWIGHFITDSGSIIAPTRTREEAANSVSFMYQTPGTIANRILSAGTQTSLTVLTADAICPKYAATEMWSCFQYTYTTVAAAPLTVGISLDGTNIISNFGGYVSVAGNFVAASAWHPLSTNNTIFYKNTTNAPGVGVSTYVDVYGAKYSR